MKTTIVAILSAAALMLFSACSSSVNTTERANPEANPTYVKDKRIITDAGLARAVEIVSVNESKVSGDLLKIQVTLRSRKGSTRAYNYKFEWIGDDGMELAGTSIWKSITLKGGETQAVSAVATSLRAVDFRLKLQEN